MIFANLQKTQNFHILRKNSLSLYGLHELILIILFRNMKTNPTDLICRSSKSVHSQCKRPRIQWTKRNFMKTARNHASNNKTSFLPLVGPIYVFWATLKYIQVKSRSEKNPTPSVALLLPISKTKSFNIDSVYAARNDGRKWATEYKDF